MLFPYVLLVLLLLGVVAFIAVCVHIDRVHKKYSHIPGPKRSSFFLGNIRQIQREIDTRKVISTQLILEWHDRYGPVMAIYVLHKALVFVSDPATVKTLLMNSIHPKPEIYDFLRSLYGVRCLGNGLATETDHERWNVRRRIFNPAFHRKELMNLMGYFNESANKLVMKLKQDADTGKPIPLMDGLCRVTLDVIAKAGFGMTEELILQDSPFIDAIEATLKGLLRKSQRPLEWMNPIHWKYRSGVRKSLSFLRKYGENLIVKCIKDRKEGNQLPDNILNNILKSFKASQEEFDLNKMVDEFITFFVAGQETTSNALGFALMELGRRPEILQRVRDEVDSVVGNNEFIEYQDVMKMEYSLLVLKEILRLYPPATGTSRSCAHEINACGYKLPAGTICHLNTYVMARMDQFFKNPLEFNPERFTKEEDTPLYAYFPFSLGHRSCIGQQFALIEARVILAKLFQNFDFKLDMTQSFDIIDQLTLKPKGNCMNYIYTRRRADE